MFDQKHHNAWQAGQRQSGEASLGRPAGVWGPSGVSVRAEAA